MKSLSILVCLAAAAVGPLRAADAAFDFETLCSRAQDLAGRAYEPKPSDVPQWLLDYNYDKYRDIRFNAVESWWNREALPFKLQFFHPGWMFRKTVQIDEVVGGRASQIPFSESFFDYGHNKVGKIPSTMGYAGFRIHNHLNQPGDELGVFQGASYFRFLCRKAVYGLSARGIAVNTAEPGGEEFPDFEDFWIVKPEKDAKSITVYALLNGPSLTGAYRFIITPGDETVMRIKVAIFCRKNPTVLGLAPLTSMYWHGTTTNVEMDDIRPQVHDSDGLMINTGNGEWLWRPLTNPASMRSMAFMDRNPKGFGLLQRERRFEQYEDLEVAYQLRPGAWVEPIGDWGEGSVRLVELHASDETSDNIVAFWVPAHLPAPGTRIDLEYNLHWFMDQIRPPAGYTTSTRYGRSQTFETDLERFVVDFDGAALRKLESDSGVEAVVTVGSGAQLIHTTTEKNPYDGSWRAAFALRPDGSHQPVELRCYLRRSSRVLSETWSYLWQP